MPTSFTGKQIRTALAEEAFQGKFPISIKTTSAGTTATALVADVAYGTSGATTNLYHDVYIYVASQEATDSAADINEGGTFSATDTTLTVDDGTKFAAGDVILIESEILKVTAVATHDLTVTRAYQATTAATHADNTDIYLYEPYIGEVSKVISAAGFAPATGTFTFAPAMTGGPPVSADLLFYYGERPETHWDSINRILRNMRRPILIPLTLIPNGDMEDSSGATTDWTASSAVLVNETSIVRHGRQSLKITATGDSGGALSTIIPLPPNTQVLVAADCYITSADAAGIALLGGTVNTDAGVIDTIEEATSDVAGWVHFEFVATTGASHEWVRLKILGVTSGDVVYFDYTTLLPLSRALFTPPSEATRFGDLGALFYYPRGAPIAGSGNDNAYAIDQKPASPQLAYAVQRDDTAVVPLRIELADTISHPLFLEVTSRYAELTADTDTTYAERDMVVQGAMYHIEMARAAALYAGNPQLSSWHRSRAREYAKTYSSMLEGTGISLVEPMRLPQARTAVRLA